MRFSAGWPISPASSCSPIPSTIGIISDGATLLGSPANSERQRAYAKARGDGRVYTPQMVVDGVTHVNGGERGRGATPPWPPPKKRLAEVKVPRQYAR